MLLWSGWTGIRKGEHGEERASVVLDEPAASGKGRRILVGEKHEDVSICGRPSLVGVKELSPATLELVRGATVQNLGQVEPMSGSR
ncbi:hypothetical protein WMF39_22330 [Sorangium sp. So ce1504]|uniref:hypothetical protein n=1 Tax=Sorangium sp. So ce1504 TaxID=3133337 RepID=UPI003F5F2433